MDHHHREANAEANAWELDLYDQVQVLQVVYDLGVCYLLGTWGPGFATVSPTNSQRVRKAWKDLQYQLDNIGFYREPYGH